MTCLRVVRLALLGYKRATLPHGHAMDAPLDNAGLAGTE